MQNNKRENIIERIKGKIMEKHFIKYVDSRGKIMYNEKDFDFEHNKLVGMNVILKEQ